MVSFPHDLFETAEFLLIQHVVIGQGDQRL